MDVQRILEDVFGTSPTLEQLVAQVNEELQGRVCKITYKKVLYRLESVLLDEGRVLATLVDPEARQKETQWGMQYPPEACHLEYVTEAYLKRWLKYLEHLRYRVTP